MPFDTSLEFAPLSVRQFDGVRLVENTVPYIFHEKNALRHTEAAHVIQ